jgi:peptide/nickel transport system permease protein
VTGSKSFVVYLGRRVLLLVISLVATSIALFLLLRLLPGSPAGAKVSVGQTQEQIALARHQLGLDKPIIVQLGTWLRDLVTPHMGNSYVTDFPIAPQIATRAAVTIPLTLMSFVLALVISVPVGFFAALRNERPVGLAVSTSSQMAMAVPVFWLGEILVLIFALHWHVLPSGGFPAVGWSDAGGALRAMVLPVVTIALAMSAVLIRYVRSAALDVLNTDYIRTFRAMGSSLPQAIWRHGLRNAAVPVTTILGIELATTLLGAVVIEEVFNLPGWGQMLVDAIVAEDFPAIQGILVVSTFAVLLVGFAADVVQRLLDPRLRVSRHEAGR